MESISYNECLQHMFGLGRFGIILGLDTIRGILKNLGNPQDQFKSIHIAGTNGKGSIASYIGSILGHAGKSTGVYTSPHLIRFNERFAINNAHASDDDIVEAFLAVTKADTGERKATFFELATAMAFYLFARDGVEWGVIETGMGGRLDATNVLNPQACVISNISLEHTQYLGNTLEDITIEKGGIIKPGIPVVTGVNEALCLRTLEKIAKRESAPLYRYRRHFIARSYPGEPLFDYDGIHMKWPGMKTSLQGKHQIDNAALALAACELVSSEVTGNPDSPHIGEEQVRQGLLETWWPGRLEHIMESPLVVLDGAHNLHAAENLANHLKKEIGSRSLTLVLGILDDKPYEAMLKHLAPLAARIIFTRATINRSLPPEILKTTAAPLTDADLKIVEAVPEAIRTALENASESDVICVAGSLYVVGEAREWLQNQRK